MLELGDGETLQYALIESPGRDSARGTAQRLLGYLAAGDIEEAALLSNAPRRRYEWLRDYRAAVGAQEFKQVFARYLAPPSRLAAEVAIGAHRLLVWDFGEGAERLAAQYYVEVEGRFLMDDVPSEARSRLRRVLDAYRSGKLRF